MAPWANLCIDFGTTYQRIGDLYCLAHISGISHGVICLRKVFTAEIFLLYFRKAVLVRLERKRNGKKKKRSTALHFALLASSGYW